jgi:hypothetical protein
MEYEIEKNVPIKRMGNLITEKLKEVCARMEPGDSIKISHNDLPKIYKIKEELGIQIRTVNTDDGTDRPRRVWRVK